MRAKIWTAAAVLLLFAGTVQAQPNEVVQHYRAYLAALDSNDLAGAEREAAAALAASEARDGDGGSTAVLALNLAEVRLDIGNGAGAVQPAARAAALAQSNADARVDPLVARLLLARAEVAANATGAPIRLRAVLDEALARGGHEDRAFLGARDLAIALRPAGAQQALDAWQLAERFTRDNASWRAEALIGQGEALIELTDLRPYRTADTRMEARSDTRAHTAFAQARDLLAPYVLQTPHEVGVITPAQAYYARTLAYMGILRALQVTADREYERIGGMVIDRDPSDGLAACDYNIRHHPNPRYPSDALARWGVAGVTVRMMTNGAGQLVESRAVSSVGGPSFSEAVNAVAPRWTIELRGDQNCSRSVVMYMPVMFAYE